MRTATPGIWRSAMMGVDSCWMLDRCCVKTGEILSCQKDVEGDKSRWKQRPRGRTGRIGHETLPATVEISMRWHCSIIVAAVFVSSATCFEHSLEGSRVYSNNKSPSSGLAWDLAPCRTQSRSPETLQRSSFLLQNLNNQLLPMLELAILAARRDEVSVDREAR